MGNNRIFKGISLFFSLVGFLFISGIIFIFVTNISGLSTLLSVLGLVKTQSLYTTNNTQIIQGAASGIVDSLKDPYSTYLDKETWQELKLRLSAEFGGIGVYVMQDEQGRLKIFSPIKGTPAYEEGVKHGDIIIKINGESTVNMTQDDAVHLMRGDPGTQLTLAVFRESDGKEYEFKITREIINVPSVEYSMADEETGIGYIKLSQFHRHSGQEMADSINKLINEYKIKGLIFDLRNNGGGDFDASVSIASIFLDGDEVVRVEDAKGHQNVFRASTGKVDIPMVVLVNQDSASASEILAGALQDNQRAVLVGEKTFGKGLVQTVFPLRDGGALKLTTQKYFTPKGTDINEIGINPDVLVENPSDSDEDLQFIKAMEIIKEELEPQR
ncbi:MAG: S41 family peptidase [Syntrophomonadaceae bacterium]